MNNSLRRFSTACNMIAGLKKDPQQHSLIDASFSILDEVAQGDFTKWSIVYDISEKKIYFKTHRYPQIRMVNFASFDFACNKPSQFIDINRPEPGDLRDLFADYSGDQNRLILEKSLTQSAQKIRPNADEKRATLAYPGAISCK